MALLRREILIILLFKFSHRNDGTSICSMYIIVYSFLYFINTLTLTIYFLLHLIRNVKHASRRRLRIFELLEHFVFNIHLFIYT